MVGMAAWLNFFDFLHPEKIGILSGSIIFFIDTSVFKRELSLKGIEEFSRDCNWLFVKVKSINLVKNPIRLAMNNCPCCSTKMLRHIRQAQIYWYCSHCKQEMPNLTDWQPINVILNNFRTYSCENPMNFSEQCLKINVKQEETVQS